MLRKFPPCSGGLWISQQELGKSSAELRAMVKSVLQLHGWIIPLLLQCLCRTEIFYLFSEHWKIDTAFSFNGHGKVACYLFINLFFKAKRIFAFQREKKTRLIQALGVSSTKLLLKTGIWISI